MEITPKGKLIIFSAPSGSGKSTIVNYLMREHPELNLAFSISCTSRAGLQEAQSVMVSNISFFLLMNFGRKFHKASFSNTKKFIRINSMEH